MILAKIIEKKKHDLELTNSSHHLNFLKENISISKRSFKEAISGSAAFILECKKASPSKGLIREEYNLKEIANAYAPFANAVSVLTDESFFQGSFEHLSEMRGLIDQPILCKDFIISEFQVYMARYAGADAILLMLSVLNDADYLKLRKLAETLGLDCLTEVHNQEEAKRAVELNANIIGINNRNLKDLSIDLNTTRKLLPLIPQDTIVVTESGFKTNKEIRSYKNEVNAFLIGSSLMGSDRLDLAVRELLFGKIKVCGLRSEADISAAFNSGASYGGLIFVKESPRYFGPIENPQIQTELPLVGVFQDEKIEKILEITEKFNFSVIQLHGSESRDFVTELKTKLPNSVEIWKALSIEDESSNYDDIVDAILFDTKSTNQFGGTGLKFDWQKIPQTSAPIVIAGGISELNVHEALDLDTKVVDVNSCLELSKGIKNYDKMANLFKAIRYGAVNEVLR